MSLTLAYCEEIRRRQSPPQASLWGFKNNQTRKERFFRCFLSFVAIKSNLDAFALSAIAVKIMGVLCNGFMLLALLLQYKKP
ncbi:hypothetical protein CDG77_30575 [Nostoc sp. 'Peltigera membranacea cyanobiont' 213]|uniref:hypothetical protein n=1 Tax=unclassified Nostoc TaxID=2593658 RepID=UPI000B95500F|nr:MULTISPECIES: hypothetical protein [unclassified Nostoc]OYD87225.1 hypothetical protein CDG77_30575 [Nostoc sp. 'Peltigera membranacea cyanobiont' 213]